MNNVITQSASVSSARQNLFDNSYSDSSYIQLNRSNANSLTSYYSADPVAVLLAKYSHQPSWGWEHAPDFVNLPPIVKGLSSMVRDIQQGTNEILGEGDFLSSE